MNYINKITQCYTSLLPVAVAVLVFTGATAQEITPEDVKASYILKMCPYITVDTPPRTPHKICYYEKQEVPESESVGQIMSKIVRHGGSETTPYKIIRLQSTTNLNGCDVLYIPMAEEGSISNILTALGNAPTLTISGAPHFILHGGMIGFVMDNAGRVKMEANLENIRKQKVKIDAQILEIMQQVIGKN